jgi:hypothetical protein
MLYGDPEQMRNRSSRPRLEVLRSRSPIKMSRGGTPQAISSESPAGKHFAAPRNDDGLFIKQTVGECRANEQLPLRSRHFDSEFGKFLNPTEALNASRLSRRVGFDFLRPFFPRPVFDHRRAKLRKALAAFDCRWFVA